MPTDYLRRRALLAFAALALLPRRAGGAATSAVRFAVLHIDASARTKRESLRADARSVGAHQAVRAPSPTRAAIGVRSEHVHARRPAEDAPPRTDAGTATAGLTCTTRRPAPPAVLHVGTRVDAGISARRELRRARSRARTAATKRPPRAARATACSAVLRIAREIHAAAPTRARSQWTAAAATDTRLRPWAGDPARSAIACVGRDVDARSPTRNQPRAARGRTRAYVTYGQHVCARDPARSAVLGVRGERRAGPVARGLFRAEACGGRRRARLDAGVRPGKIERVEALAAGQNGADYHRYRTSGAGSRGRHAS